MDSMVDPSADYIFESVAQIADEHGITDKAPHTDEEWKEVRRRAVQLLEAPNLLVIRGRKVARPGEEELVRMESRSLIVVPLERGGKRLGVLAVTATEPGHLGDEDFELVSELARRVSLALDLVG